MNNIQKGTQADKEYGGLGGGRQSGRAETDGQVRKTGVPQCVYHFYLRKACVDAMIFDVGKGQGQLAPFICLFV